MKFWIESFLGQIQWKNEFSKRIEHGYLLPTGTTWAPTFVPHNAWTLSSRQRQIQTQCKKANTNWPTAPPAPPPICLVLQRSPEANQDRRSISHNAMSSVSISAGFETTTMANNVSAANNGMQLQERDHFCLASTKLKRWLVYRNTSLSTRLWREVFSFGTLCLSLLIWDLALCLIPIFFHSHKCVNGI